MYKKIILRVNLVCEASMDAKAPKEILRYFFPYQEAIPLYIDIPIKDKRVTTIYPPDYEPVADISLSFFIRSKKRLYMVLAKLIYLAIRHLNETNYHRPGVVLTSLFQRLHDITNTIN